MGVQSLYSWIKKTRPQTITTIRNRFSDPRIRGKPIALDATLITNVLHFRNREDVGGKQALIGWYTMIREMRAAKVEPIAIWDQRGTREWKAAEAKKRLATRALLLARRNHEDERATRLQNLKETLLQVQELPEAEKNALREHWAKESWTRHGPPESQEGASPPRTTTPKPSAQRSPFEESRAEDVKSALSAGPASVLAPTASTDAPQPASSPVSAQPELSQPPASKPVSSETTGTQAPIDIISKLSSILESYRLHDRPRESLQNDIQPSTAEALGHIRDLEVFMGEPTEAGQVEAVQSEGQTGVKERDLEIDGKLQELVPFEEYTETATQQGLTVAEGGIIDALLGVGLDRGAPEQAVPSAIDLKPQLERLDRIIEVVPKVRQIYARALKLPSRSDHDDCRELLVRMGVPVLIAEVPYEAEGLASSLARKGLVDFVATEDSDVLGYEGPLLRYAGTTSRALQYISGQTVREQSDLTPEEYLDFIVLLGTDASPRIRNVGPANAYKLIKRYGSIENILEEESKIRERTPEGYMDMVKAARAVFSDLPEIPTDAVLEQGVWDEYEVNQWLEEEHGLSLTEMEDDRDGIERPRWSQLTDDERFELVYDEVSEGEPDWEELVRSAIEELEGLDVQLQDDSVLKEGHPWGRLSEHQMVNDELAFLDDDGDKVTEDWGSIADEELRKME